MDLASLDASARLLFDALAQHATAAAPTPADATGASLADGVAPHWDAAQVLSLDVFDTALVRKVRTPKDVFLFLYALPPIDALGLTSHRAAELRVEAENAARLRARAERGTVEVGLEEVYRAFLELVGAEDADDVIPALVTAEQTAELAVCAPHPAVAALYRRAKAEGKPVWFVSDTYHSAEFLRQLLQHNGYDDPADLVVASSDHGVSKGEGQLFAELLAARPVRADRILHVGDHPQSDCAVPRRFGIRAVQHPLAATTESHTISGSAEEALVRGLAAIGERCHEPRRPFWWRLGYAAAGPALAGFALWLHEELRRDAVQHAYFLLRDGEILKRVYDVFAEGRDGAVPSSLLHSSRRAFMVPALQSGAEAMTTQLFVSASPRPAAEYLTRLDVSVDGLDAAFRECGFTGPDEVVGHEAGDAAARLIALFSHPEVAQRLGARSSAERQLLIDYLRQEGVLGRGRTALIDIGWNGTIQKALHHATALAGVRADVTGYYFGTAPACAGTAGMRFKSYFFHLGEPRTHFAAIFSFRELVELVCSSARGSLRRYERRGGRVEPVCAAPEVGAAQLAAVAELHAGILAFAEALRDETRTFDLSAIPAPIAGYPLVRVIGEPTPEEAATIGAMQHGDNMGSGTARHLARFSGETVDPAALLRDYRQAYWRRGLLGQRNPQAMVLRNALWLAGV